MRLSICRRFARQLGTAFGIDEQPVKQEYGWAVGSTDGSGPSIWVGDDATVSWSFADPNQDPWSCGVTPEPAPADAAQTSPAGDREACVPEVAPIGQREALREARKILGTLGVAEQSVDGVDIEWETGGDDYTTWATAWQRVDGQRTQLSWSFTFTGEQVAWANGFAPVWSRCRPTRSSVRARRSRDRASRSSQRSGPRHSTTESSCRWRRRVMRRPRRPRAPSRPGRRSARVQVWWDPMVAVSAERSLAQYWQPDGTLLILPAYRVTTADDRGTWAIIAVAETAIDFVAPTE